MLIVDKITYGELERVHFTDIISKKSFEVSKKHLPGFIKQSKHTPVGILTDDNKNIIAIEPMQAIQFPTDEEAYCYALEQGVNPSIYNISGYPWLVIKSYNVEYEDSPENWVVYTPSLFNGRGSDMYVSEGKNPTFNVQQAKKFTKHDAEVKAKCMTKNSPNRYFWTTRKVKIDI